MRFPFIRIVLFFIGVSLISSPAFAQNLMVGTNYHPHDLDPKQWDRDIKLMHDAGFKVVRLGHLDWDSYQPTEDKFTFEWFDEVMNKMDKAGIKVILDVAVRPAPLWLHRKYPSINITDQNGTNLYPNHRYMEDVGDPMYQQYALHLADVLTKRYAKHPALIAFGIDNEPGDGRISYSETVRARFITWLKSKYQTTDRLNIAWAAQRWSRKISDFEEIGLPLPGTANGGAPERLLDFRRFISDEVVGFQQKLVDKVTANAPNAFTTGNMWYYVNGARGKYFDYAKTAYTGKITREGSGFYPGTSINGNGGLYEALFGLERIQYENTTPIWSTEFTTYTAVPNAIRKYAYASLFAGNQVVCGWTWQTMHGGEEQFLEGMMDWDGGTNRKYDEYKQIASEFKKIEKYGFPYKVQADVALAFSFPTQMVSGGHEVQTQDFFTSFFARNIDTRVVDLTQSKLNYKLLILPGVMLMDELSANNIREFVKNGGTVLMTNPSAVVDEHNQVFRTTQPGLLSDVFGIRVAAYETSKDMNEISPIGNKGDLLQIEYNGKNFNVNSYRFDVVESRGAEILGKITSLPKAYPIITSNKYGKGRALYIGASVKGELMNRIIESLIDELKLKKGPDVPQDVIGRYIDAKHILYLNMGREPRIVKLKGLSKSILYEKDYTDEFSLAPNQPEFIEIK